LQAEPEKKKQAEVVKKKEETPEDFVMGLLAPGTKSKEIKQKLDKVSNFMKDDRFLEEKFMDKIEHFRTKKVEMRKKMRSD
jgi:hypothetical protein